MSRLKTVVFDMDGVIFDSERFVIDCWIEVAKKHGVSGIEEACRECIGTNSVRTREIMLERYGQDFPYESFALEAREVQTRWIEEHGFPQKAGVKELLEFLKKEGVKMAIASSTRVEKVKSELKDAGFLSYFQVVIGGDMVSKSKPEPDIFLEAMKRLEADPSETYIIEDSYNGVRAAYRSGARAIMVPDLLPPTGEMKEITFRIFDSLSDVKSYFETLI